MKLRVLITLTLIISYSLITSSSFTQNIYIKINGCYGLPMSSQNIPHFYNSESFNDSAHYEQINVSLGKGFSFGGAIGYMHKKFYGFELGVDYLLGSKIVADDKSKAGNSSYTYYSRMLRIKPMIVLSPGFEKVNPYAKFGVIFGFGKIVLEHDYFEEMGTVCRKYEMNGGYAFGGNASMGIMYNKKDHISFFVECEMIILSYAPIRGEVKEFTQNGTDLIPYLTEKEKVTEYVDDYSFYYDNPSPDSEPDKELKTKYPFGSFGISLGVQFKF